MGWKKQDITELTIRIWGFRPMNHERKLLPGRMRQENACRVRGRSARSFGLEPGCKVRSRSCSTEHSVKKTWRQFTCSSNAQQRAALYQKLKYYCCFPGGLGLFSVSPCLSLTHFVRLWGHMQASFLPRKTIRNSEPVRSYKHRCSVHSHIHSQPAQNESDQIQNFAMSCQNSKFTLRIMSNLRFLRPWPRAVHSEGTSPGSAFSSDLRLQTCIIRALWALWKQQIKQERELNEHSGGHKNWVLAPWKTISGSYNTKQTFHAPGTPGGVLMNLPLKCWIMASHFSVDSILKHSHSQS